MVEKEDRVITSHVEPIVPPEKDFPPDFLIVLASLLSGPTVGMLTKSPELGVFTSSVVLGITTPVRKGAQHLWHSFRHRSQP